MFSEKDVTLSLWYESLTEEQKKAVVRMADCASVIMEISWGDALKMIKETKDRVEERTEERLRQESKTNPE